MAIISWHYFKNHQIKIVARERERESCEKRNKKWFLFDVLVNMNTVLIRLCLVQCKIFSGKKYFQVFGCIMKIVLENIFMYLVTFWKCYFPPSPNRKTTKTLPPTPPQQQQQNQRSKRESKKSKSHRNVDRFVGRSKSHKKSKSHRERSVRGFVVRRLWVTGEVEGSWVEGSGSKISSWVRRSVGRRL